MKLDSFMIAPVLDIFMTGKGHVRFISGAFIQIDKLGCYLWFNENDI
jgi:hypothetical protein